MPALATLSYTLAALAFGVLAILLSTGGRGSSQARWLTGAIWLTAVWALLIAACFIFVDVPVPTLLALDGFRALIWIWLLAKLLAPSGKATRTVRYGILLFSFGLMAYLTFAALLPGGIPTTRGFAVLLLMSLLGLLGVEQVYRNADFAERRVLGWLGVAIGGPYAYDLFVFSDALLLGSLDGPLWTVRGFVNACAVPLFVVGAKRHRDWAEDLFISRQMVFYSATFMGAGLYLLAMSAGGYLIRQQGGEWGRAWQAVFVVAALVMLAVVLFSTQFRVRARVFLAKHFYRNRYDYREEWLHLITTLASDADDLPLKERCVKAIADILNSPGGELWLSDANDQRGFVPVAAWNVPFPETTLARESSLVCFLERTRWIVDTVEYQQHPERYQNAFRDAAALPAHRIVVPLIHADRLVGVASLVRPDGLGLLNFEDHDLLKTVGRQVAVFVAQERSNELLAETRQFETFNKLTAFLMHDLKNLVSQQGLLLRNAERHKHRPEFIDDMIGTVASSVSRMKRILQQLERGRALPSVARVDVSRLVAEVANECDDRRPQPQFVLGMPLWLAADRERLRAVFTHAIRNAQDATPADGCVEIAVSRSEAQATVEIRDSGEGMDADFIRDRLFRPFDSTKGAQGMGIGAYQVREFVRELGGEVEVESTVGAGTVFRVRLPLSVEAQTAS